ncbi:unnamed protein product [Cyprideis torosa]|uniref:Periplasmic chaperone PpiD n=1 Tax=Cyprideis torosa TaxID=163714 RepID=A0A7R8WXV4_9CRUS|nr:unnamed protein product [Cyprideis torosa]CAG0908180.1 unnamed protein product [Cyprideis torosa]
MFGGKVPAGLLEGGMINQSVLSGMIREELLRQYADEGGFRISEPQVVAEIQAQPVFQDNGAFNADKFDQLLQAQRRDKKEYVQNVKLAMQIGQLQSALDSSAFMTQQDYAEYYKLKNQTRAVEFIKITQSGFIDQAKVTDEDIEAYYNENSSSFLSDEQVKLNYLVLDLKALESQVKVDDELLQSLYDQEKDRFRTPSSRHAQHILIALEKGEEAAQQVAERLAAGEDFATVAAEVSADKLSAEKGGDIGFIYPGDMDPEFEKALFTLEAGEISSPVKTALGFHLIKYTDETPSEQKTFAEAKGDIEKEYRQREADRTVVEKSEQLLTLSYENHSTLEPAADALGLKIQTSEWISRQGVDGLWREPKLLTAAFSDEVLQQKRNSDVMETGDGKQVVLRVTDHKPAATRPLQDVKDQVAEILKKQQANKMAQETGAKALAALESGSVLAEVAAGQNIEVNSFNALKREQNEVSAEITSQLFKMSAPVEGKLSTSGFELANGDFVVAALKSVTFPDAVATAGKAEKDALIANDVRMEIDAVLQAMEARADIKIFTENIQSQ